MVPVLRKLLSVCPGRLWWGRQCIGTKREEKARSLEVAAPSRRNSQHGGPGAGPAVSGAGVLPLLGVGERERERGEDFNSWRDSRQGFYALDLIPSTIFHSRRLRDTNGF